MAKKPGIPAIASTEPNLASVLLALKENVEIITGARPKVGTISQLASTASLTDVINKVNEIIIRLNVTGK